MKGSLLHRSQRDNYFKELEMKKVLLLSVALGVLTAAGASQGGTIIGWDQSNVVTDPGPYVEAETYYSIIYNADSTTVGGVMFKYGDVQPPGLKVVNGDDVDGTNCLMTTGYNPYDLTDKQCSDPLQSSKRFKLKNLTNGPLDVTFNVVDGPLSVYRSIQKWTDGTDTRWSAFTIDLGFMVNGVFVPSTAGDGLGFSDTKGSVFTSPVTSYQAKEDVLSALFAQGLAGPADAYHPETGYFNTTERMSFAIIATEDTITSDGISATYSDVFGQWVNTAAVPIAIFYDDDGDLGTDNILMANCADPADLVHVGTHSGDDVTGFTCDGQWVTFRSEPGLACSGAPCPSDGTPKAITLDQLAPTVYTSVEHAQPYSMYMDYIEDAANLGYTFWIAVADNTQWPTPGSFVIRYTPVPSDGSEPPPADPETACTDGIDNDGDGQTDCADSDCEGVGICGPEGRLTTCSDGYDNDGDGDIDCADAGCARNRSCR